MSSEDELKVKRVNSGINDSRKRKKSNKQRNTIQLGETRGKHITPKNERKFSQDYLYETFKKIMYEKEIKLFNKEEGNVFKIILLKRDTEEPILHQDSNKDGDHIKQMKQLHLQENEECNSSENCDLESSLTSIDLNQYNSVINFKAKFISSLSQGPFDDNSEMKDNKKGVIIQKEQEERKDDKPNINRHIGLYDQDQFKSTLVDTMIEEEQLLKNNCLTTQYDIKTPTNTNDKKKNSKEAKTSNELTKLVDISKQNISKEPDLIETKPKINKQKINQSESNQYDTEFTFNLDQNRRYKVKYLTSKKDYFQMRYLNQNLKKIPKIAKLSNQKDKMIQNDIQKNFYFYFDNRNVIKYISLFFKKIETAIFHFNTKQYDKAYHSLLDNNIIYNIDEFGEVLLLILGFDKAIVGEFFSNEKTPNERYCVTKSFVSKLDFRNEEFLPSFRFFMSLFVLPNQNESVLLDYFSAQYFEDNLDKKVIYKNETYVKSLCLLAMDANNLFKKQSKGVSKEDFLLFNPTIDKEMSGSIYEDIKRNNIHLRQDNYNEEIYKKLFNQKDINLAPNKNNEQTIMISPMMKNVHNVRNSIQKQLESEFFNKELIILLKQGEIFKQKRPNGVLIDRIINLSEDEQFFYFKNIGCLCTFSSQKRVSISDVERVYRGSSSIISNENDYFISMFLKESTIELYNSNIQTIVKWFNGINFLMKRKHPSNGKEMEPDPNSNKHYSSIHWSEIVNHWVDYREVFKLPTKKACSLAKSYKNHKSQTIYQSNKKSILSKRDAYSLWTLGLPQWIRSSLWKIILVDRFDICENLLLTYQRSLQEEMILLSNNSENAQMIKEMIAEIKSDIKEVYEKYQPYIHINEETFNDELYIIIRGFCLYRPDIVYSDQIAYFSMIFYLNSNSYFEAFVFLCNFIIPNCFFQFSLQDEVFVNEYTSFFYFLLKKYSIDVHKHFNKFGINLSIFFLNWVGYLFATTFEYETVLRIWDNFLLKGNIYIFEVAIAIVIIQEKDLLNSSISSILNNLKYFPKKYSQKDLFDKINSLNIADDFEQHFELNEIGKEKGMLYQVYFN